MIEEGWRYFAPSGAITPGGPSTWHILDWDQRRMISVTMDEEQETEDAAIENLKKHIDTLGPNVTQIYLSQNGDLISVSTDPEDDEMHCPYYPPLEELSRPDSVQTVLRSELRELDRLGPNVDLVSYKPCSQSQERRNVVFKYYFLETFIHKRWHEMNLWMRLPQHPNVVPFDRIVLDELNGRVVGFTSLYIPGGTIEENTSRVFKLKWLKQLISLVDDMNLKYGIAHQDIAARNLLVDSKTDNILLFDFNFSSRIGGYAYDKNRDDMKGVIFTMYEIITRDDHFRSVPHEQQNPADVEGLDEWVKHPDVKLDHDVSEYRSVLSEWVKKRQEGKPVTVYTEAPEYIDWSEICDPPRLKRILASGAVYYMSGWLQMRRDGRKQGKVLTWERPRQNTLVNRVHLLANGEFEDAA